MSRHGLSVVTIARHRGEAPFSPLPIGLMGLNPRYTRLGRDVSSENCVYKVSPHSSTRAGFVSHALHQQQQKTKKKPLFYSLCFFTKPWWPIFTFKTCSNHLKGPFTA